MDLYFVRHGDAEPASPTVTDEARHLTERGKRETLAVVAALERAGVRPEAILTSPLARARETAGILERTFGIAPEADERLRSGFTLGSLQALLADRPCDPVVLVGHEPDFSRAVGQLVGGARVEISKSGLARVRADRLEPGGGALIWLLTPQALGPQ